MDKILYLLLLFSSLCVVSLSIAMMIALIENMRLIRIIREIRDLAYEGTWGQTQLNIMTIAKIAKGVK